MLLGSVYWRQPTGAAQYVLLPMLSPAHNCQHAMAIGNCSCRGSGKSLTRHAGQRNNVLSAWSTGRYRGPDYAVWDRALRMSERREADAPTCRITVTYNFRRERVAGDGHGLYVAECALDDRALKRATRDGFDLVRTGNGFRRKPGTACLDDQRGRRRRRTVEMKFDGVPAIGDARHRKRSNGFSRGSGQRQRDPCRAYASKE